VYYLDMDFDFYSNADSAPAENKPLIKVYGLLCSLIEAFTPDIAKLNLRDGSGERYTGYVDEALSHSQDQKLQDFKVRLRQDSRGVAWVSGEEYARQIVGLVNYLYKTDESVGYYCGNPPLLKFSKGGGSGPVINNHLTAEQQQKSEQNTTVSIEFNQTIISLTETLTKLERDYPDKDSKENKFAGALKKALPNVKNTLDIVALVLKIAGEVGLNPQTAMKILGLG
jgi:hypothetical protein